MDVERFAALGIVGILAVLFFRYSGQLDSALTTSRSDEIGTSRNVTGAELKDMKEKEEEKLRGGVDFVEWATDRTLTEEEVFILAQHMANHFRAMNAQGLMATAWVESSFRPWVSRYEPHLDDSSYGLMQTLIGTAQWLHNDMGYRDYAYPTRESLKNPAVSMYYGAAYFHWLQRAYPNKDMEWYVRAYNGGAGHKYNSMTTNYWNKWQRAFKRFGGGSGVSVFLGS